MKSTNMTADDMTRDPSGINRDLKLSMEEVFAEPASLRTPEPVWLINYYLYEITKKIFYLTLVIIIAPILSLIFGIILGLLAFIHIWIFMPLLKICKVGTGWAKRCVGAAVDAVIIPCAYGVGFVYSGIKVQHQKVTDDDRVENVLLI